MSKKRKTGCWVRLDGLGGAAAWREVPGAEPITIVGWDDLDLYLHRDLAREGAWVVTVGSTGQLLAGERYRKDAVAKASERLGKAGRARVEAAMAASREGYGLPPGLEGQGPPPPRPTGETEEKGKS